MVEYNEKYGEYTLEKEGVIVCWEEEPDEAQIQEAEPLIEDYNRNIVHIAEAIMEEFKDFYEIENVQQVIDNLKRPKIDPDMGQVVYCEHTFDNEHIISFEYGEDFSDIDYIALDG